MKTMILILGIFIAGCFGHHALGAHTEARHRYGKAVEIVEPPQPYQMNYDITDEYGNQRWRQESGDEYNNKKGSYGYRDAYGLSRSVEYVADEYGFRVMVNSNEPGVETSNPADAQIIVDKAAKAPKEATSEDKKPKPYSGYGYGQAAPKRLAPLPKREKPTVPEQKMAEPKRVGYISYAPEPMKQEIVYGYTPMSKPEPKQPKPVRYVYGYAPMPKPEPKKPEPMKHVYAPEPKTSPTYTYDYAPAPMKPEPMNPEPMKQEVVYGYAPMPKPKPVRYVYQYAPLPKPEPKKPEPVKYGYEHASAPKLQTMAKKSGYNYAPKHPEPMKEEVVYEYAPMSKPESMKQNMGYGYAPMLKPRPMKQHMSYGYASMPKPEPKKPEPMKYGYEHASAPELQTMAKKSSYNYAPIHPEPMKEEIVYGYAPMPKPEPKKPEPMKQYMGYGYAPMPKPEPKKPEPVKYVYGYAPEPKKPEPMKYGYEHASAPKLQTMAKKSGYNYAPKHPEPMKEDVVYGYAPMPEPEPKTPEPMKQYMGYGYAPRPKSEPVKYGYEHASAPKLQTMAVKSSYNYAPKHPEPIKEDVVYGYAPMPEPEPKNPEPMKQYMGYGYAPMPKPESKKPEPMKYSYEHASAPKLQSMAKKSGYNYASKHPKPMKEEVVYGYAPAPAPEPEPEPKPKRMAEKNVEPLRTKEVKYVKSGYSRRPTASMYPSTPTFRKQLSKPQVSYY